VNQTARESNPWLTGAICILVGTVALACRWQGDMPPFDDAYHLKRIESFPRMFDFDPDRGERGAFVPWPPLYDFAAGAIHRASGSVEKLPPLFFALCAGTVTAVMARFGWLSALTAGLTIAVSPYLIGVSRGGRIDHHFVEPALLLAIVVSLRRPILLGLAITAAIFVQPAMIIAAGIAYLVNRRSKAHVISFALPALIVLVWRLTRADGYPDSPWFLGYPHVALLAGAAIAAWSARPLLGAAVALSVPQLPEGLRFFTGDPWLETIVEFQPMFSSRDHIGTDIANLTGGVVLIPLIARRHRAFALFAAVYLLLALSSRRFLVPAVPLFAIAGALDWRTDAKSVRPSRLLAAAITILPPLIYVMATASQPQPSHDSFRQLARDLGPLPRGRVLAPWSFGHPIDVIGQKPVIVDGFGSMAGEATFVNATFVMLTTRPEVLLNYCRARGVRYLVLPHPTYIAAQAATVGIAARVSSRTVWARLYSGERMAGFTLARDGSVRAFLVD
jgi:hypothetical protein